MIRRRLLMLTGLLLAAIAAGLAVLPARWLMRALPAHWPLAIVAADGTVWSGSATLAVGPGPHQRTLPEPVRWSWSFRNGPQMTLTHPWLGGPLILAPSFTGLGISAQTLRLPAQALASLDARIAAIGPEGRLSVAWPPVFLGLGNRPAGTPLLTAEWREAASALTPIRPIGHYAIALKQAGDDTVDLTLSTRQGPLILDGAGMLDPRGGLRFDGVARADPAASSAVQAALFDVLSALGPRQNDETLLHYR